VCASDSRGVEHRDGIRGHSRERHPTGRQLAASAAAVVERHDPERACEHSDGAPPRVAREAEAHDQQYGRTFASRFKVEHGNKFT
jgi:hypothetical protein